MLYTNDFPQICIAFFFESERPLIGTTFALAFTYLTYALMPNRLKDALLSGTILATTDILLLVYVGHVNGLAEVFYNKFITPNSKFIHSFGDRVENLPENIPQEMIICFIVRTKLYVD